MGTEQPRPGWRRDGDDPYGAGRDQLPHGPGDGTLWTWGYNASGQLGNGTTTDRLTPAKVGSAMTWSAIAVGFAHSAAVRTTAPQWAWGYNGDGELGYGTTTQRTAPAHIGTSASWASVTAGDNHTVGRRLE